MVNLRKKDIAEVILHICYVQSVSYLFLGGTEEEYWPGEGGEEELELGEAGQGTDRKKGMEIIFSKNLRAEAC